MSPLEAVEFADDLAIIVYVVMFLAAACGACLSLAIAAICGRYRMNHPRNAQPTR